MNHLLECIDDVRHLRARTQNIIATAIEREVCGLQRERPLKLLVNDGPHQLPANRKVCVVNGLVAGVRPALRDKIRPPTGTAIRELVADALGE